MKVLALLFCVSIAQLILTAPVLAQGLTAPVFVQGEIPIPVAPKEGLPGELIQSRGYAVGLERQMAYVSESFPTLAKEVVLAESSWKASPFYTSTRFLEKEIVDILGDKGRQLMQEMDAMMWDEFVKHHKNMTVLDAREFLVRVAEQAKGDIKVDMVRGQLLSHYKPFQENPEKEMSQGYVKPVVHTAEIGRRIEFHIPMSWKQGKTAETELMAFRSNYGHGDLWMTVTVFPSLRAFFDPMPMGEEEAYGQLTEDFLRADYKKLGIELTSFTKTKLNGVPVVMFTRRQPYKQPGTKSIRAAQAIRVFTGNYKINFQINTLGPEGEPQAEERIKEFEPLFKLIGSSLRIGK